jgi:hypothetical protein
MGSAKEGGGFTAGGEADTEGAALGIGDESGDLVFEGFDGGLDGLTALLG